MTLKELKEKIDMYVQHGHEDDKVAVRLSEPSVGCLASTDIKSVYPGIDWDNGTFFIETAEKITSYSKDRDKRLTARGLPSIGMPNKITFHCPKCGATVKKDFRYCSVCGQAIVLENAAG